MHSLFLYLFVVGLGLKLGFNVFFNLCPSFFSILNIRDNNIRILIIMLEGCHLKKQNDSRNSYYNSQQICIFLEVLAQSDTRFPSFLLISTFVFFNLLYNQATSLAGNTDNSTHQNQSTRVFSFKIP